MDICPPICLILSIWLFLYAASDDNLPAMILVIIGIAIELFIFIPLYQGSVQARKYSRAEKEKKRIENVTRNVEAITVLNQPKPISASSDAEVFDIGSSYINKEILINVNRYKDETSNLRDKYSSISAKLNNILSYDTNNNIDEKEAYLNSHMDELKQLKRECDEIVSQLSSYQIEIIDTESDDGLEEMKKAFQCLRNSCKLSAWQTEVDELFTSNLPSDLKMFKYKAEPLTLYFCDFYYCLFCNVILIFDRNGAFSNAVDPTGLKITVTKEITTLDYKNDKPLYNSHIGEDSKLISTGSKTYTWLHARVDGERDMRYSENYLISHRSDKYEYTQIRLVIADKSICVSSSSQYVADAFDNAVSKYIRQCNMKHNPIPGLLVLLKSINNDVDVQKDIDYIMNTCMSANEGMNYFCKLVKPNQVILKKA